MPEKSAPNHSSSLKGHLEWGLMTPYIIFKFAPHWNDSVRDAAWVFAHHFVVHTVFSIVTYIYYMAIAGGFWQGLVIQIRTTENDFPRETKDLLWFTFRLAKEVNFSDLKRAIYGPCERLLVSVLKQPITLKMENGYFMETQRTWAAKISHRCSTCKHLIVTFQE